MSAPTKTPRTDALTNELHDDAVESGEDYRSDARRLIAHARILENELAIARTDIEQLKTVCANYRKEAEIAVAEADELRKLVRFAIASNQDALNTIESIGAGLEKKE